MLRNRSLLVMRHAQSNSYNHNKQDFDRPLDDYGQRQPAIIAQKLNALGINISHALVSPALRTKQTFDLLALNLKKAPEVFYDSRIYNASLSDLTNILDENIYRQDNIILIGHNPAVSELVYSLAQEYCDFKPACLAILHLENNSYSLYQVLTADG